MLKVGIYSGTFDPVHNGHVSFAVESAELFGLDKVYFLVEPRPRRKQGVKALGHRVNMVQIAVKDNPKLGTIIIEQARFTTHETLPILLSRFKGAQLHLLIGDDTLDHIAEWPHVDELTEAVDFIIGARKRKPTEIDTIVSRLKETKGLSFDYNVFNPSGNGCSSSYIKRQIRAGKDPKCLNEQVLDYIKANKLYFSTAE